MFLHIVLNSIMTYAELLICLCRNLMLLSNMMAYFILKKYMKDRSSAYIIKMLDRISIAQKME